MKNTGLSDLRATMFDVLMRLQNSCDPNADPKDGISIESAKAMTNVAHAIVNSSKLEIDAMKIIAGAQNPNLLKSFLLNSEVFGINSETLKFLPE
jgi:hypothetical protein